MQGTEKGLIVTQDILDSPEYKVIEKAMDDLHSVLLVIEDGISKEFDQLQTLNMLLESQVRLVKARKNDQVVSMDQIKKLHRDYVICRAAVKQKAETIKNLNSYLHDRMMQMKVLQLKRDFIIQKYQPAEVFEFRGKNEKETK